MPEVAENSEVRGSDRLEIGGWTVEPALNEISAAGKTLKLEPKAIALLCYLAERPGQVVSREALLSAVWPGVVVGDDSLTQAVVKLRKALGDTPESSAHIQTISKKGYRLVAPVTRLRAELAEQTRPVEPVAAAPDPQPRAAARKSRVWWISGTALAALLAVGAGVWWIEVSPDGPPGPVAAATPEATRAAQPTLRISPFEALGDDPQVHLLARGITADLVTDLSKVFGLSVITSLPLIGQVSGNAGVAQPAAQYLVSGSVQRADDRLRLQVHLVDAQTGKQLWSERFDRTVSSLFALQEELVSKLLHTLPAKVSEVELRRVAQHHTRSLEAYEYFQRGQMALLARQHEENEVARDMFRKAIGLDASFALAYAALARTYVADHRNQWTKDRPAALERAFVLATTAHQINPDVPETYWVLALVHLERGEHSQALDYLQTAVRLYPSFADAYALMGGIACYMGQPAQTLPLLRTAMRLKPEAGYLYFLILGRAYFALGDMEQARINLGHALMRNAVNLEARVYMAAVQLSAGNKEEAAWEAEEIRGLQPDFSVQTWLSTHPLKDARTRTRLAEALAQLGL